ncbi:hypothetical protein IU501_33115 [Nocardia otitidiscaviarum]|uniref:hypothetical protein n=1 Tax=Nocardia otitidiscaviarum TaxID=1823 RepID=UPI0004A76937|nr:hypothetical protein [Nocardia otitidiscaviarum]MBF6137813.1 hypothetical protein [Nocardia otitidiscaviarum]MBF6485336.1 hypothetical protein [Nocardia otitidiscaviarum]
MNAPQNPPSNETTTAGKEPVEHETPKLDPLLWLATAAKQSAERIARTSVTSPGAARITAPPKALAQVWTDPESDHPGPSIVITNHGVDPATRVPVHPRYRDWLPYHHGDADEDILASATTALDAAGWNLLGRWASDDIGWRATVVRQPPITHRVTDFAAAPCDEVVPSSEQVLLRGLFQRPTPEMTATLGEAAARVFAPRPHPGSSPIAECDNDIQTPKGEHR